MRDESQYSVQLRQSDNPKFTAIFNESDIKHFLDGSSNADYINGTNNDEVINTHNGSDLIKPLGGVNHIDGGTDGSKDTVVLNGKYADYLITEANTRFNGNDYDLKLTSIFDSSDTKIVRNIDSFQFSDKTLSKSDLSNSISTNNSQGFSEVNNSPWIEETLLTPTTDNLTLLVAYEGFDINNFNFYNLGVGSQEFQSQYPYLDNFASYASSDNQEDDLVVYTVKDSSTYSDADTYPILMSVFFRK